MLTAIPRHWYSWDFSLREGDRTLAEIDTSAWREKGTLTLDGTEYRVSREGVMSGAFLLQRAGSVIARAEKPSAFRRRVSIRHADRSYELRIASAFGRRFVLFEGSRQVGAITPTTPFTRTAQVELPDDLPLPVRVFIVWLTLLIWKRDAAS